MERKQIISSNIKSIGYDSSLSLLEIEFNKGGLYQYHNVPTNIFNSLMRTTSKGTFFHQFIERNYRCVKLR